MSGPTCGMYSDVLSLLIVSNVGCWVVAERCHLRLV